MRRVRRVVRRHRVGEGAETAWLAEIDPAVRRVLARRPLYGDITAIDWSAVPRVDVLAGGTPCQDPSQAGRSADMADCRLRILTLMRLPEKRRDETSHELQRWEAVDRSPGD